MMTARRNPPSVREAADSLDGAAPHAVEVTALMVPDVQGQCEIIEGDSAEAKAQELIRRLREMGVLGG